MKRTIALSSVAAAAVLSLIPPAVAHAQERQPVTIEHTRACGTVTLTFANPAETVHGFRWNAVAGNVATGDGARTGLVTVAENATVEETIRFDEDEFDGTAAVTVSVAFGPDSDIQPRLDIYPVDTDCAPPVEDPEPTEEPDPTDDPEPTEEPEPTPTSSAPAPEPTTTVAPEPTSAPAPVDDDVELDNDAEVVVPRGGVNAGGVRA